MSNGVVGMELLDDRVVAMEAVVASSNEGGVHGGSLPEKHQIHHREPRHIYSLIIKYFYNI